MTLEILEYEIVAFGNYSLTVSSIIGIIITLAITKIILILIVKATKKRSIKLQIDEGRFHSIYKILSYLIWTFSILICVNFLGVEVGVILAGSAALLVGIGFGLQNIFSDLVAGFVILFEGTIEIKDIVEVDGVIGRVKKITLRQTTIITQNDYSILVPNHKFTGENVINWSHDNDKSRFSVNVGVAYGSNKELVTEVLLTCAKNNKSVEQIPKPFVRFNNFGDSSLDFQLFFWSKNTFGIENIKSDLRYHIDTAFAQNNIQIPFPQRDVHLSNK
jgi:small-conductance mechanosensitive channel